MLMLILPSAIVAGLLWVVWTLRGVWHTIPRSNADFDLAGQHPAARVAGANPAGAFYGDSLMARALGVLLRLIDHMAPAWGTRSALRLFVTPLPWKLAARRAVPSRWEIGGWPFEDGALAFYRRRGIAADKPTVLLVHGWAGSAGQMFRLGDALADAGFDPVLLDFPGHGRSGGWHSTLPQFGRAIYAAASRLGPLHAVVAHSLGAVATMHAAARGLPAQRLVLIAPSAPPAAFLRWFAGTFGLSESVPERMRLRIESREAVALAEFEPEWLGPRIAQRSLVIHDRGDRVAPFHAAEQVVRWLTDGRLLLTQGLGHRRVLEDRAVAREIIAHLARC
jgi:pimeloyl-ACP methyl ester carboxylesterase